MFLSYVDGDNLHRGYEIPWWEYDFERKDLLEEEFNLWKKSDSELTEYVKVLLFENYNLVDADVFYPGELDKWEEDGIWYGFVYDDGERYRYVWLNMITNEVKITDEVEDYTGEG